MTFLSEIRTVSTARAKLPPAPKRAPKSFTMAELIADAKAAQRRLNAQWHQAMPSQPKPTPSIRTVRWSPEKMERLEKEILKLLRSRPYTTMEMLALIRMTCNRHKLAATLTEMRAAGKVKSRQATNIRKEWSLA